jgi:putative spermidine/putrescine transport system ATP-binding protein
MDTWTARFLGHTNLLGPEAAASLGLACESGQRLLVPERAITVLDSVHENTVPDGVLLGHVLSTIFEGRSSRITVLVRGVQLEFEHPCPIEPGTRVQIRLEHAAIKAVQE